MFRVTALVLFLFASISAKSQSWITDAENSSRTWYLQGQWDSIIIHQKRLYELSGLDYYYLRYRLAEAYFQKGNYELAAYHFDKTSKLNSLDTFCIKRKLQSLLAMGRYQEGSLVEGQLQKQGVKTDRFGTSRLNSIHAETEVQFSSDPDVGDLKFFAGGFGFAARPGLSLQFEYQQVNQDYYFGNTKQEVFHGLISYANPHGLRLQLNGNLVSTEFIPVDANIRYYTYQSAGIGLSKHVHNWQLGIESTYSNFNYDEQIQGNIHASWWPKGNSSFSIHHTLIAQYQFSKLSYVSKPSLLLRLGNRFYLSAYSFIGNTTNLIENEGSLLNNSLDNTRFRASLMLNWFATNTIQVYVLASHVQRTEAYSAVDYTLNGGMIGLRLTPWYRPRLR